MKGEYRYRDINQVMRGIRQQIIDSVEWCYNNIPPCEDPQELWNVLKPAIRFKHDPAGAELLQEAETLFEDNWHGSPGMGDCDCFTVLGTAAMIAQGWKDMDGIDIVLAGRSRIAPVHIYNYITWNGQTLCWDMTEPRLNKERSYPLKQVLPLRFYN